MRRIGMAVAGVLALAALAAVAVGTTCSSAEAEPWCVPLRTSPDVAPGRGVATGSADPWADHAGEVVVLRLQMGKGELTVGEGLRVPAGGYALDEANRTLRLQASAPAEARGALVMPDGSLRLVPVSAKLAITPGDHVLAILLPDYVQLDVRPTNCTVGFAGREEQYRQPVGTGMRPGESQTLLLGPDEACPETEATFAFVGRWSVQGP